MFDKWPVYKSYLKKAWMVCLSPSFITIISFKPTVKVYK